MDRIKGSMLRMSLGGSGAVFFRQKFDLKTEYTYQGARILMLCTARLVHRREGDVNIRIAVRM